MTFAALRQAIDADPVALREKQREENRRNFPMTTKLVDALRDAGLKPRIEWAREGENEIGRNPYPLWQLTLEEIRELGPKPVYALEDEHGNIVRPEA